MKLGKADATIRKSDQSLAFHFPPAPVAVQPQQPPQAPDPPPHRDDLHVGDPAYHLEVQGRWRHPLGQEDTHASALLGPPVGSPIGAFRPPDAGCQGALCRLQPKPRDTRDSTGTGPRSTSRVEPSVRERCPRIVSIGTHARKGRPRPGSPRRCRRPGPSTASPHRDRNVVTNCCACAGSAASGASDRATVSARW